MARHKSSSKPPEELVRAAMRNKRWDYRTAQGISVETKLPVTVVNKTLTNLKNEVRVSLIKTKSGKDLYTLKSRRSALGDFWYSIRKLSRDKFEVSNDDI